MLYLRCILVHFLQKLLLVCAEHVTSKAFLRMQRKNRLPFVASGPNIKLFVFALDLAKQVMQFASQLVTFFIKLVTLTRVARKFRHQR